MPDTRDPKWGEMTPGGPRNMRWNHFSDEWHDMEPSEPKTSEKWVDQEPSKPRMSEKWVDIETDGRLNPQWNTMEQDRREDPYVMQAERHNRPDTSVPMPKEKPGKRHMSYTINNDFGSSTEKNA